MMQQVTIRAAKAHLSRLIEAALNSEEIVITKGNKPVARLVPVPPRPFHVGLLAGQLANPPDFLAPMDAPELDLWEAEDR